MMRRSWLFIVLLLLQITPASSAEKPPPLTAREIKALVDALVSPNPAPDTRNTDRGDLRVPRDYDHSRQTEVHRAYRKLTELGPQAFPFLIERSEDDRYCLTIETAGFANGSVGEICRWIIDGHLQPYGHYQKVPGDPRGKPHRPNYVRTFLGSQKEARRWWKKHKDQTLAEMQLEVLDWVIAEEAKRRRDFTDGERQYLEDLRGKLARGDGPLGWHAIEVYVLPRR
jgi:hypothetical protein